MACIVIIYQRRDRDLVWGWQAGNTQTVSCIASKPFPHQEERLRSEHNLVNIQKTHERMQTENKSEWGLFDHIYSSCLWPLIHLFQNCLYWQSFPPISRHGRDWSWNLIHAQTAAYIHGLLLSYRPRFIPLWTIWCRLILSKFKVLLSVKSLLDVLRHLARSWKLGLLSPFQYLHIIGPSYVASTQQPRLTQKLSASEYNWTLGSHKEILTV